MAYIAQQYSIKLKFNSRYFLYLNNSTAGKGKNENITEITSGRLERTKKQEEDREKRNSS
jgi:hypothetical protein